MWFLPWNINGCTSVSTDNYPFLFVLCSPQQRERKEGNMRGGSHQNYWSSSHCLVITACTPALKNQTVVNQCGGINVEQFKVNKQHSSPAKTACSHVHLLWVHSFLLLYLNSWGSLVVYCWEWIDKQVLACVFQMIVWHAQYWLKYNYKYRWYFVLKALKFLSCVASESFSQGFSLRWSLCMGPCAWELSFPYFMSLTSTYRSNFVLGDKRQGPTLNLSAGHLQDFTKGGRWSDSRRQQQQPDLRVHSSIKSSTGYRIEQVSDHKLP